MYVCVCINICNCFFPLGPVCLKIPFTWLNTLNGCHPKDSADCRLTKDNSFWALYITSSVSFITLWLKHLKWGWGAAGSERTYKRGLGFWMIHPCHVIENKFSDRKSKWFQKHLWTDRNSEVLAYRTGYGMWLFYDLDNLWLQRKDTRRYGKQKNSSYSQEE